MTERERIEALLASLSGLLLDAGLRSDEADRVAKEIAPDVARWLAEAEQRAVDKLKLRLLMQKKLDVPDENDWQRGYREADRAWRAVIQHAALEAELSKP